MCAHDKIAGVLLAGGSGSRMGGGKLLLKYKGKPLIEHALASIGKASFLSSLTIVLGYEAHVLQPILEQIITKECKSGSWPEYLPYCYANNLHWKEGMSTSLQAGVKSELVANHKETIKGVMFLLSDQPLLSFETINSLAKAHIEIAKKNNSYLATVPLYKGQRGTPVTLSPELIPEVMAQKGDVGARIIIKDLGEKVLKIEVDDAGTLHDVDTKEAYEHLLALEDKSKKHLA